jgi:hypothetical protein
MNDDRVDESRLWSGVELVRSKDERKNENSEEKSTWSWREKRR